MSPTCDLCPRAASRWYEPAGAARCGLHESSEVPTVPAPPPDNVGAYLAALDGLAAARRRERALMGQLTEAELSRVAAALG